MSLAVALVGAVMGLLLGLLGGGGSVLAVPMFVYGLDMPPAQAVAASLAVVGVTSLVGAVSYWRAGLVDVRRGLIVGGLAMGGGYAGAAIAARIGGPAQLLVFIVVLLTAAVAMLTRRTPSHVAVTETAPVTRRRLLIIAAAAAAIGVLTGVVGIGGGFLFVPALVLLARMPMPQAIGTSLLVIAMNAAAATIGYVGRVAIPWDAALFVTGVAVVGVLAGGRVACLVPQRALQRAFGVVLLLVAGLMLHGAIRA
jgi:uncharacterized membrane protein YfcA